MRNDRNWDDQRVLNNHLIDAIQILAGCVQDPVVLEGLMPVRFMITSDLPLGGKAPAVLMKRKVADHTWEVDTEDGDPDPVPKAIFVRDPNAAPGFWAGVADFYGSGGYQGWAIKSTGETEVVGEGEEAITYDVYLIIWMERIARKIEYQVNGAYDTGSAFYPATLVDYHDGISPLYGLDQGLYDDDEDEETPEVPTPGWDTIKIYDPTGYRYMWHGYGCKGVAIWNDRESRYEIEDAELHCKKFRGTLDHPICSTGEDNTPDPILGDPPGEGEDPPVIPFSATVTEWCREGEFCRIPHEYKNVSEDPEVEDWQWVEKTEFEVDNFCDHRGADGAKVIVHAHLHIAEEGDTEDEDKIVWNIEDIAIVQSKVIETIEWDEGSCDLKIGKKKIYVEECSVSFDPEPIGIPFALESLVEGFDHVFVPDVVNPENASCKIVAYTGVYCALRRGNGDPVDVIDFTARAAVTDINLNHDDEGAPEDESYSLSYSWDYLYVPCWWPGGENTFLNFRRQDVVDSFEHINESEPEEVCEVVAHTKEVWVIAAPDPAANGVDIPVLAMDKRRVITDVYFESATLKQQPEELFVLCYRELDPEDIIGTEECPE